MAPITLRKSVMEKRKGEERVQTSLPAREEGKGPTRRKKRKKNMKRKERGFW